MQKVTLYTDGGCRGNPGIGGWSYILEYEKTTKELAGNELETTNNRMELTAVIQGLRQLKRPCDVKIVSDSKYVCQGLNEWLPQWLKRGWKTAHKQEVKNTDLWKQLNELSSTHQINCVWVKGHAGHPFNERADQLANKAMDQLANQLK